MNITEFLEARIKDDEAQAAKHMPALDRCGLGSYGLRVLAECAAKRAIVSECRPSTLDDLDSSEDDQPAPMWVARALASVYADHPDYQQEWSVDAV